MSLKTFRFWGSLCLCFMGSLTPVFGVVLDETKAQAGSFLYYPSQEVQSVIRAIAAKNDLQVLIPDTLSGSLTLRVYGDDWREQFWQVLKPQNYTFEVLKSGLVVIKPIDQETYSFPLRSVSPDLVKAFLDGQKKEDESIFLVSKSVLVSCLPDRRKDFFVLLQAFDVPQKQVYLECRFEEVSKHLSQSLGVDWSGVSGARVSLQDGGTSTSTLSVSDMSLVLKALNTSSSARTISKPSLYALDGQKVSVSVGQQYPLPQYEFSKDSGNLQVSGFTYKDIGVLLTFQPHFITDDLISVDLTPEVSSVADTLTFGGSGASTIPVIATRKVNTRVQLKNGETIVISGLIDQKKSDNKTSLKCLGNIPVLGSLFRDRSTGNSDSELLIFVTVRFL